MVAPPGTTLQNNINDLIFEYYRYACEIQKHTKHTLFLVFEKRDSGDPHCVYNIVKEHSSSEKILLSKTHFGRLVGAASYIIN